MKRFYYVVVFNRAEHKCNTYYFQDKGKAENFARLNDAKVDDMLFDDDLENFKVNK